MEHLLGARVDPPLRQDHPLTPIVENRKARAVGRTVKVVSFNAQGGRNLEGIVRCLRQEPLAGADIVLLCEADWRNRRAAGREFAAEVARALNLSLAYIPQFGERVKHGNPIAFTGNAILCSQPLEEIAAIPIANRFTHRRLTRMIGATAGMVARARFGAKVLNIGAVHLNSRWSPAGRAQQMSEYLAKLPEGQTVLGGDLNTTTLALPDRKSLVIAPLRLALDPRRLSDPRRWEGLFQHLEQAGFKLDGSNVPGKRTYTFSRLWPTFMRPNLDWIALRGLKPVRGSARVVAARPSFFSQRVSDHDFVMCEFRL
jgi:hypothetical protein